MTSLPSVMRAWQYTAATPTMEANLILRDDVPLPALSSSSPSLLIRVISVSLNPVDYKVPELPLIGRFMIPRPATPGSDFCGRVVKLSSTTGTAPFHIGDLVFGRLDAPQHGACAEYIAAPTPACARLPSGVDPDAGAAAPTTGLTEYKVLRGANVQPGDKVFINGGAGGTGTMGIQIAKAMGCHVTTTCSSEKIDLCKRMGADEVIDYTKEDVVAVMRGKGRVCRLVLDNVGRPAELYHVASRFLLPQGSFVQVGMPNVLCSMATMGVRTLLPSFLGGGSRRYKLFSIKGAGEDLAKLGYLMAEGTVKPHIEKIYEFEKVPEAFAKLREGHCVGKLVVHVGNND